MEELENKVAEELNLDEMGEVVGGYKRPPERRGFIIYQIKKGDSLGKIAKDHGVTVAELLIWNPKINNKNLIYAGDYLYIKKS